MAAQVAWTDPDEHQFFVPNRARWDAIQKRATNIGETLNKACAALEEQNSALEGVLAGIDYNDERKLGDARNRDTVLARLVQHFSQVSLRNDHMAEPDLLGRAYEYLIEQFRRRCGQEGRRVLHAADGRQAHRRAAGADRTDAYLRPDRRFRRHADRVRPLHRTARGQSAQPDAPRPGEEPRHLGHLQDEHAAPRAARRPHRERRHDPGPEAGR